MGRKKGRLFARGWNDSDRERDQESFRRGDFTRWAELAGLSGARAGRDLSDRILRAGSEDESGFVKRDCG